MGVKQVSLKAGGDDYDTITCYFKPIRAPLGYTHKPAHDAQKANIVRVSHVQTEIRCG